MTDRACMAIIENGQILMVRQIYRGTSVWTLPGGGIEIGESPEEAAIREAKEEVHLSTEAVRLLYKGKRSTGTGVYYCFLGKVLEGYASLGNDPELATDKQELQELRWFSIQDMIEHVEISKILPYLKL